MQSLISWCRHKFSRWRCIWSPIAISSHFLQSFQYFYLSSIHPILGGIPIIIIIIIIMKGIKKGIKKHRVDAGITRWRLFDSAIYTSSSSSSSSSSYFSPSSSSSYMKGIKKHRVDAGITRWRLFDSAITHLLLLLLLLLLLPIIIISIYERDQEAQSWCRHNPLEAVLDSAI